MGGDCKQFRAQRLLNFLRCTSQTTDVNLETLGVVSLKRKAMANSNAVWEGLFAVV